MENNFYYNKNWIIIEKGNRVFLYNFVSSKELIIEKDIDQSALLLQTLSSGKDFKTALTELKKFYPNLSKDWFTKSLKVLRQYGIVKKVPRNPTILPTQYLSGLDRQVDYFEDLFPNKDKYKVQKNLKETKVAVLGLGSVAQHIIQCLVASGIGNYVCVDFDIIEERNIGRQPIFRRNDVGKSKVQIIKKYITESRFGNKVKVVKKMLKSPDDVEKVIKDCDIVLHCCDYPRFLIHQWINEACIRENKPNILIHAGRVGPLSIPHNSSCFGCLEAYYSKHFLAYDEIKENIIKSGFGRYPTLSVVSALTGVIAAKEVLAFILGMPYESHNAFLDIRPSTLEITRHELKRQKDCYACGKVKK